MNHLLDMTPDAVAGELASLGQPAYRAGQVLEWVWRRGVTDFAEMANLPAELRCRLADRLAILTGRPARRTDAADGVIKLLVEWPDHRHVETVLIPAGGRRTACLSTQVGCPVGCAFCASGIGGLERTLSAGEIVEQIFHLQAACRQRVTHVVVMGMGEPLLNYDATVAAVRAMIDPARGGISARRVTVSTVGLPNQIRRLAGEDLPITLAISLHAPNDTLRRELIPAARGVPLEELIRAAAEFFARRHREVTLEYVLLAGVNDSPACAAELAAIARRLRCNVNLIRFNPVPGLDFRAPDERDVRGFRDHLRAAGVNVHIRTSRGADADAACGQLRRGGGV